LSRGYWREKDSDFFGQTAIFVQWVLRERKLKFFRSKRPEMSRGYWREKVSEPFGQTAHFPPVGSGRKKFPKKRTTSPVSVKGVLNEEFFKLFRSKPAKPSSG
jgi:hypothetical protein